MGKHKQKPLRNITESSLHFILFVSAALIDQWNPQNENDSYSGNKKINFNPFIPSDLFYLNPLDQSITTRKGVWLIFIFTMYYRNSCI